MRATEFLDADEAEAESAKPPPPSDPSSGNGSNGDSSVLNRFAEAITWPELVCGGVLNWAEVAPEDIHDSKVELAFKRPGGSSDISAKVLKVNPHVLVVHSDAAGLPYGPGQKNTKPRVYAYLHYDNDLSAASKALLRGDAVNLPTHVIDACKGAGSPWLSTEEVFKMAGQVPPSAEQDQQDQGDQGQGQIQDGQQDQGTTEESASSKSVEDLVLPEVGFYDQREMLQNIRDYAHSRGVSADTTLYAVLARNSGMVPKECRVETGIGSGGGASLNLDVAAVGPSGTSKSASASVARDVFAPHPLLDFADSLPIGSGEGIAEAFMGEAEEETGELYRKATANAAPGDPKTIKVRKQVRHNAFLLPTKAKRSPNSKSVTAPRSARQYAAHG